MNTAASLLLSWDRAIPVDDKAAWRDPWVAEAYQAAAVASDPTSPSRNPPSFRAPSGAMADSFDLASGRKLWDAGPITAHVLVIRSQNDFWSRPEDVTTLAQDLRQAASVRTVTIPGATHYVHLDRPERGRSRFIAEVTRTLAQPADVKPFD
ncbi:alpha/beta fold hydrolase [Sinorhizobium saheli]|uniref:alpha/beta fold hydrolase n=1 Tax=Sinorhizobium saheli TaxID=36856 RepID=UPI000A4217D4|nr:alpha/beta hydrolase [Sinorhizobium saheli]